MFKPARYILSDIVWVCTPECVCMQSHVQANFFYFSQHYFFLHSVFYLLTPVDPLACYFFRVIFNIQM